MLNRSASLAMSTSVLKALPGKLDIKRHSPSVLYLLSLFTKKLLGIHSKNEEKITNSHYFFKMSTNDSPPYLSSLVSQTVDHASSYNLGNSHNLRPVATRTNLYYNSFLPSVIRDWNELPVVVK